MGVFASENGVAEPNLPNAPASWIAGAIVQSVTGNRMTKVRETLHGFIQETWVPFTAAVRSRFLAPRARTAPWQSPDDLDAGERITRGGSFPVAERPFPWPYQIGAVSAFLPMQDQYSMAWAYGRNPSGPGVLTPTPIPWDTTYPNATKVTG